MDITIKDCVKFQYKELRLNEDLEKTQSFSRNTLWATLGGRILNLMDPWSDLWLFL